MNSERYDSRDLMEMSDALQSNSPFRLLNFLTSSGDRLWTDYLQFAMKRLGAKDAAMAWVTEWVAAGNTQAELPRLLIVHQNVIDSVLHNPDQYKARSINQVVAGPDASFGAWLAILSNGVLSEANWLQPKNESLSGHIFMCIANMHIHACHTKRDFRQALGIRRGLFG